MNTHLEPNILIFLFDFRKQKMFKKMYGTNKKDRCKK